MSSLAKALDAYAMAVAYGADSTTKADRFADLTAAHEAHVTDLYRKEQA